MKRLVIVCFILLKIDIGQSQNLVPNSSFEGYKLIPCNQNEFFVQDLLQGWVQPLPTSTDYWTTIANDSCYLNPQQIGVIPRSGFGVVGVVTAYFYSNINSDYKEYVEIKLDQKLIKGKFYSGEFFTQNRNNGFDESDIVLSNNLGIAFSDTLVWDYSYEHPDHLLMNSPVSAKEVIPNDNQWHRVCNCFISDGNYEYVLLGNFEKIDSTKVVRLSNNFIEATAYYFIDDVSVRQLPYDVSNLEKEITFCHTQDHIELNAFVGGATGYLWPDGSTSNNFFDEIRSSHKTTVEIFFNECSYEHTFKISYIPDINLGADTLLCLGETLLLSPDYPSSELIWSDGSTDSARLITSSGTYAVEVPGSCPVMDTVTVNFIDCPGFVPNVFTPNKDEYNPVFQVENIQNRTWLLQVFNRWGKKVYESEKYTNDWDGATLPEGIYYYLLYSPELDKKVKGWVKIIREKG